MTFKTQFLWLLILLASFMPARAATTTTVQADFFNGQFTNGRNYVTNYGAEKNIAGVTGTNVTVSRNTTTPLWQSADFGFTMDSASDTVDWSLKTIDNALGGSTYSANCAIVLTYTLSIGSGNTDVIQWIDGSSTTTIASTALNTLPAGTALPFFAIVPCGDSANTKKIRIAQTAGTSNSVFNVDNVQFGQFSGLGTAAQSLAIVRAYRNGTQAIAATAATKVQINTVVYDTFGEFDPTTNFRFTAKAARRLRFKAQIGVSSLTAADQQATIIRVNGTDTCFSGQSDSTTGWDNAADCTVDVAVGDQIEVYTQSTVDNAYNVVGTSKESYFEVQSYPTNSQVIAGGTNNYLPTYTVLSGSGTYIPPPGAVLIDVKMVGASGGGGAGGTGGSPGSGSNGSGASTFGSSLLTANAGNGGSANAGNGGAGGTATVSAPANKIFAVDGSNGGAPAGATTAGPNSGGNGGSSCFGGAGAGGTPGNAATAAKSLSGSGGGGGSGNNGAGGAGGGAGGCLEATINNPSSAGYAYSIATSGAGGTPAGTGGAVGAAGSNGYALVTEYYSTTAPYLIGSVTSPLLTNGGINVYAATIVCSSSSSIVRQSGTWITGLTNIASSRCTGTIATGAFSGTPYACTANIASTEITVLRSPNISVTSATSFTIGGMNQQSSTTAPGTADTFYVTCVGPR